MTHLILVLLLAKPSTPPRDVPIACWSRIVDALSNFLAETRLECEHIDPARAELLKLACAALSKHRSPAKVQFYVGPFRVGSVTGSGTKDFHILFLWEEGDLVQEVKGQLRGAECLDVQVGLTRDGPRQVAYRIQSGEPVVFDYRRGLKTRGLTRIISESIDHLSR